MAARGRLDRRARVWLAVLIVVLLVAPLVALRSCITTRLDDSRIVASSAVGDRLISLKDGSTMLLVHGTAGRKIADWLSFGTTTEHRFAIGDETFASGSAEPTEIGSVQLGQFAQMLKVHPELTTKILVTKAKRVEDEPEYQLEQLRSHRLRDDIIAQGVNPSRIVAVEEAVDILSSDRSRRPELLVVLERVTA